MSEERIELHCHTKYGGKSAMYPGELIKYLSEKGMPAFAITDESSINAYPEMEVVFNTGTYSARPIFGMQMKVQKEDESENFYITVLVKDNCGRGNLYKIISNNADDQMYPVYSYEKIVSDHEGLLLGSGTDTGRVYKMAMSGVSDNMLRNELSVYDYVEVLPFEEYEAINKRIISLCDEIHQTVVAVCEPRYYDKTGRKALSIMEYWNNGDHIYRNHIWSTEEMLNAFSYLPEEKVKEIVIENTHRIAKECESINACPKDSYYPMITLEEEKLRNLCNESLAIKYVDNLDKAKERLEWELDALSKTNREWYLLILKELFDYSNFKASDISSRGTGTGSIVTYLLGITEVDPLRYDLLPEIIYGSKKNREFWIDINVPFSESDKLIENFESINGIQKVVYEGSLKQIRESMAEEMVEKYEEDTGDFIEDEDIKNKIKWCISGNYTGKSRHSGGLIIFPEICNIDITTPLSTVSGGCRITCFDYHALDRSFIKYNFIPHSTLEKLKRLSGRTGIILDDVPYDSEEVLNLFKPDNKGVLSGCSDLPEFSNKYVQDLVKVLKPDSFNDLVKIIAIGHGTGTWDDNGEILVKKHGKNLKELIATRDDVFDYCSMLGIERETAFSISEFVRKGRASSGRYTRWAEQKKILIEAGAPEWYIWSCERIWYLFPRAHAISYLYMTMRIGWFKVHYPEAYKEVMNDFDL